MPISVVYLWSGLLQPLLFGMYLSDLEESYLRAARRMAAGLDPYDLCQRVGCLEPTGPQYVTPPLVAWLLQPAVGLDGRLLGIWVIILLNLSLAVFLVCALRALKVRDRQVAVLLALIALSFEPVIGNIDKGQVNLVLLALSGVWLLELGFIGGSFFPFDSWAGVTASVAGVAFGAGVMIAGFNPVANVSWVRALILYAILEIVYQIVNEISIGRFDTVAVVIAILVAILLVALYPNRSSLWFGRGQAASARA